MPQHKKGLSESDMRPIPCLQSQSRAGGLTSLYTLESGDSREKGHEPLSTAVHWEYLDNQTLSKTYFIIQ